MSLVKAYYHIHAFWVKLFWKIIYGSKLNIGEKTTFRRNFTIAVEDMGVVRIGTSCFLIMTVRSAVAEPWRSETGHYLEKM